MHDSRDLLTTAQAAKIVGLSPRTLEGYRLRGNGPTYFRVGKRAVRYDVSDVLAWAKRVRLFSTSESDIDRPRTVSAPSVRLARQPRKASSE